ncbi:MAG: GNAT family N-acetyltransferase [Chitinophagales bacterium]
MKIDIRLAGKEDSALIADLSRQTFHDTFASQNTVEDMDKFMKERFTREALMNEVGTEGNVFMIAFIDAEPAGYVRLREGSSRPEFENKSCLEIARIYVINKMIGKGVGSELMQKCIDVATEGNKELLWLGVWKENTVAIDFYKRWGFEIFGEQDFLLGNDLQKDWLMKKEV